MASSLLHRISLAISRFEYAIVNVFARGSPPGAFAVAGCEADKWGVSAPGFSLKDVIGDGFLWGMPTARRTIERRLKRKFGNPDYVLKILQPKSNIRTCNACGDEHLVGELCSTCYKKVINETKEMQEAIQNELKLEPVEKEVAVLYEGERNEKPDEFWEGKRIIEIKKPRPSWFSKNLLQQTTQESATTTDVKPSDLG